MGQEKLKAEQEAAMPPSPDSAPPAQPPMTPSVPPPSPVLILTDSEANIGDDPQDNTLGLAIGLPLGGLFLAALAAIFIWMRRKRRMKQPMLDLRFVRFVRFDVLHQS